MKEGIKYKTLFNEMKHKKVNQVMLANELKITKQAFHYRLYGNNEWKMSEIKFLLNYFNKTFNELFPETEDI